MSTLPPPLQVLSLIRQYPDAEKACEAYTESFPTMKAWASMAFGVMLHEHMLAGRVGYESDSDTGIITKVWMTEEGLAALNKPLR